MNENRCRIFKFLYRSGLHVFTITFFTILSQHIFAQSVNIPFQQDYYHFLDRLEIKSGKFSPTYHASFSPLQRKKVVGFLDSLENKDLELSTTDRSNIQFLYNDSREWDDSTRNNGPDIWNTFYKNSADLFSVNTDNFDLHLNPVLYLTGGLVAGDDTRYYTNTRGIEVRGMISKKVGFYSFASTTQALFPDYVKSRIDSFRSVPQQGFYKRFKEDAYDFFSTRGYISFNPVQPINIQFGHDRFFAGHGYRSVALSDFSNSFLFLKFNTEVWKISYNNLFGQMIADVGQTTFKDPKYFAYHHLSINLTPTFNLGLFESVVYGGLDSAGRARGMELEYLNPVIFYRAVESHVGSSEGNAIIGADFRWLIWRRFSLYGQFLLDEFLLDNVRARDGWWANKYAAQVGLKYIDAFGLKNFDLQLESNWARPYTYAHSSLFTNYSHFGLPLAHPMGANFREFTGIVRYQPTQRLLFVFTCIVIDNGEDSNGSNWGGNIMLDYSTREQDRGNELLQGVENRIIYLDATISYMLFHNFFIDMQHIYRQESLGMENSELNYTNLSLRWNIFKRIHSF